MLRCGGKEAGRHGLGRTAQCGPPSGSGKGVPGPLAPEFSSITSIDLFITSRKGSFICQAKLPLYLQPGIDP